MYVNALHSNYDNDEAALLLLIFCIDHISYTKNDMHLPLLFICVSENSK